MTLQAYNKNINNRHADAWMKNKARDLAARPEYKKHSSANYLAGPCPSCGGDDRFYIYRQSGRFNCRQCRSAKNILQAMGFNADKDVPADYRPKPWKVDYKRPNGDHAFTVSRVDAPWADKTITQTAGVKVDAENRILPYRPKKLAEAPILIVEGEKCASVASQALPQWDACCWQRAVQHTDWSHCKDRAVWLWMDSDQAGRDKLLPLAKAVLAAGAASIKVVKFCRDDKWDCADAVEQGDDLAELISGSAFEWSAECCNQLIGLTSAGLRLAAKQLGLQIRFNLISLSYELNELDPKANPLASRFENGTDCIAMDDQIEAKLREIIKANFVRRGTSRSDRTPKPKLVSADYPDQLWTRAMKSLGNDARHDPLRQYLEELEPWDGVDRRPQILNFWEISGDPDLMEWASFAPFLTLVWRTFRPGTKVDEVPVLCGPGGIGKSTWIKSILPPDLQQYFSDCIALDSSPRDKAEQLRGVRLLELPEMNGMHRSTRGETKRFISSVKDLFRLPYDRHLTSLPRIVAMIGTADTEIAIPDDPNSRRWVCISPALKFSREETFERMRGWTDANRDQVFAQARHWMQKGNRPHLPPKMAEIQQRQNAEFQIDTPTGDVFDDALCACFVSGVEIPGEDDRKAGDEGISMAGLKLAAAGGLDRFSDRRIGEILKTVYRMEKGDRGDCPIANRRASLWSKPGEEVMNRLNPDGVAQYPKADENEAEGEGEPAAEDEESKPWGSQLPHQAENWHLDDSAKSLKDRSRGTFGTIDSTVAEFCPREKGEESGTRLLNIGTQGAKGAKGAKTNGSAAPASTAIPYDRTTDFWEMKRHCQALGEKMTARQIRQAVCNHNRYVEGKLAEFRKAARGYIYYDYDPASGEYRPMYEDDDPSESF